MSQASLRQRRRRRLAIIGGVFLLIIGAVVGRYLMVSSRPATNTASAPAGQTAASGDRAAGLAAFEQGDDAEALTQLAPLVTPDLEDPEVLYAVGVLHERRADNDQDHLLTAVTLLRKAVTLDPDHLEATRKLLEIMVKHPTNVEPEMVRFAQRLLREDPDDPLALRGLTVAYGRQQRLDDAIAAADQYLSAQPLDVSMQRRRLDLLKAKGWLPDALMDETWRLREAHPEAAEPLLAEAYVRLITDDSEASVGWLDRATRTLPRDREFVHQTVEIYDRNSRYDLTLAYLEKLHEAQDPNLPLDELARRRFEADRFADAASLIAEMDQPTLALRTVQVLALLRAQDRPAAESVVQQLRAEADEGDDAGAQAVAAFLRLCVEEGVPAADILAADQALREAGVRNPYFDYVVGQAHVIQQQTDEAQARFEKVLSVRPVWAAPGLELAKILREKGDFGGAARYAFAASKRQPNSLNARVELALSLGGQPDQLTRPQLNQLLNLIDSIQAAAPGEPRTLALRVDVLASSGDVADADATARAVLDQDPPPSERDLLQLITLAERHDLPSRDELRAVYADRYGQTLRLTMQQANELLRSGDPEAALTHLEAARPEAPSAEWDVNRALLLERTGRADEARVAWREVASAYPQEIQVQQALLQSSITWADTSLIQSTVDRLKNLDGPDQIWRIAQARLWLASDQRQSRAQDVIDTLEPVAATAEVRYMQAAAHQELDQTEQAIRLLREALRLNPGYSAARLSLATLMESEGEAQVALDLARPLAADPDISADQRRLTAALLIRLGDTDRARGLLQRLEEQQRLTPGDALLLARLHQQAGDLNAARGLAQLILEQPSAAGIAFVADLYARLGDADAARQTLSLLDSADLPPAEAQTVRAAFQAVHGDSAAAESAFRQLTVDDPTDATAWRNLISFQLRSGRLAEAMQTARASAQQMPDNAAFAGLLEHLAQLRSLEQTPDAGTAMLLALTLLEDAAARDAAGQTLQRLSAAYQLGTPDERRAARGRAVIELADQHPDYELLQRLAVGAHLAAGRRDAGLDLAQRTMQRFPASATAAKLATDAWSGVGRWREAVVAAEAWSDRTPGDRAAADATVARLHRLLGRPNVALQRLSSYRPRWEESASAEAAGSDPVTADLLQEYVLALGAAGQVDEAWALLRPRIEADRRWRTVALEVAASSISNLSVAQNWLKRIDQALPPLREGNDPSAQAAAQEHFLLTQAYLSLGRRNSRPELVQTARDLAAQLSQRATADATTWFTLGMIDESLRNLEQAAAAYRRAVELKPAAVGPRNNLAMVLADAGGPYDEALSVIDRAIELSDPSPNLQDTRGYVLLQAQRYDEAIAAVRIAMQLDPANPAWPRRLSEIQAKQAASAAEVAAP